ncbi:MAG TPA: DUF3168 domain-containing protein [Azospirillaceae bacterium]|nr:DUF3168 domain-containing protein [Azospirillaceae bacterium]
MANPGWSWQQALHDALSAALGIPIYDGAVPDGAQHPYAVIGREVTTNHGGLTARRVDGLVHVTVWSTHTGRQEMRQILAAIDAALHNKRLPMDEGQRATARIQRTRITMEPDGQTHRGLVVVRVTTEH